MQHLLATCPILPAGYGKDLLRALAVNGRHISQYLSTYFSPNTHLLGEAVALLFIGTLCPQISAAEAWRKQGWRIIQQEAKRQVRPDGVYFEQSLYYHVYALDFLLHARLLGSRNGAEIPSGFDEVIRKMLVVVQALAQVGPPDGFGDDDRGRLFNPRRNRAEHITDPLALGAALFHDDGLRATAALTEEAIWLFGVEAVQWTAKPGDIPRSPQSYSFKDGGIFIAAGGEPLPHETVIDAGPQGTGRSGHGHADALSIKISFRNRPWLVDAGTFSYITPGGERQAFRGTRAHNTLVVDELDQAQPEGPFAWSALPVTQAECWIPGATFSLFAGGHSGYERLPQPVRHRRFVFHLYGVFWLVRDVAEGQGSHLLETSWHFAPDLEIVKRDNAVVGSAIQGNHSIADRLNHLTLLPVSDPRWKSELVSGFVSPAYGATVSAPVLRCGARVAVPAEHAMLFVPAVEANRKTGNFSKVDQRTARDRKLDAVYQYDDGESTHNVVFDRSPSRVWSFGPWTSDAKFLYHHAQGQQVQRLVLCEGSFLQFQAESLFSSDAVVQWLDWTKGHGAVQMACSNESVAGSFASGALGSQTLEPE